MSSMDRISNSLKLVPFVLSLACPLYAAAGNYATCLLNKLPGVQNQAAISAAVRLCGADYPDGLTSIEQGADRGIFAAYNSGDECLLEKSKDASHPRAVNLIRAACSRLYDESPPGFKPYSGDFTPLQQ